MLLFIYFSKLLSLCMSIEIDRTRLKNVNYVLLLVSRQITVIRLERWCVGYLNINIVREYSAVRYTDFELQRMV